MAEPSTDGVEVHARPHQVTGGRMPQHMRRDFPPVQRGHTGRTPLHEAVDPEPGKRFSVAAEEDGIATRATIDQLGQRAFGARPQWALARLCALPVQGCKRVAPIGAADLHIAHAQLRRFGYTRPGIVEKQQKRVFGPSPKRRAVGHVKQGLHLGVCQPGQGLWGGLLGPDGTDAAAPFDMDRIAAAHEAGKGADRRQALVAGLYGAAAVVFQIGQEPQHAPDSQVVYGQAVNGFSKRAADERQQQREGVPVALLGVAGQVALGHDVFAEETPEPSAQRMDITHRFLPFRSVRSAARLVAAAAASLKDRLGCPPGLDDRDRSRGSAGAVAHRRPADTKR